MTLTIQDILNKDADEILKEITIFPVSNEIDKSDLFSIKENLNGFFKDKVDLLVKGSIFKIQEFEIIIDHILKSSGRVFFKVQDFDTIFSITLNYLLGNDDEPFSFQKGDIVKYKDEKWIVTNINPASRNVSLKHDILGIKKISIDKIEKAKI